MRVERQLYSLEAGIRKGRELPDWFLDEPPIPPNANFFIRAFDDLSTCRDHGMGYGPIPWDRIVQYGYHAGLDDDMVEVLIRVVRRMDNKFLDQKAKERKNKD